MTNGARLRWFPVAALAVLIVSGPGAGPAGSKPEDVGMSSERLNRIHPMIQGHLDARDFPAR